MKRVLLLSERTKIDVGWRFAPDSALQTPSWFQERSLRDRKGTGRGREREERRRKGGRKGEKERERKGKGNCLGLGMNDPDCFVLCCVSLEFEYFYSSCFE